jgi:hypothetical protein
MAKLDYEPKQPKQPHDRFEWWFFVGVVVVFGPLIVAVVWCVVEWIDRHAY